jgi:hypothetical protein
VLVARNVLLSPERHDPDEQRIFARDLGHSGWKDGSKALLRYFEDVDKWEENPLSGTGL